MPISDLIPWRRPVPVRHETDVLDTFRREMDRMFDSFYRGFDLVPFSRAWSAFGPQVDVVENDEEIVVSAELPGLDDKDIEVSLSGDMLTISGEKKREQQENGRDYYRAERWYGAFRRSIPLPCEVRGDKVDAVFQNGVLTITLPKVEAQVTKRIQVKAA